MPTNKIITKIVVDSKQLIVLYDKQSKGLHCLFETDGELKDFIEDHLDKAFLYAVRRVTNKSYVLNIASTENFGAFEWRTMKSLLKRQMFIFMPLIQKFIVDARTDTLVVPLDEETNPQDWMVSTL